MSEGMSASEETRAIRIEKREYPRVVASCPIRYQTENDAIWHEAQLMDYSATGVRMICDDLLLKGTKLKIVFLPGELQKVPSISAEATVVRFSMDDECRFQIGCEFTTVVRSLVRKASAEDYAS